MKIAIASIYTENIQELANLTINKNKYNYCKKHNYSLETKTKDFGCKDIGFAKIYFLLDLLNTNKYDWIYWCGADTLITNFSIKLESFLDTEHEMIVSCDLWDWNVDCFFVKNTEKMKSFLRKIISQYDDYIDENGKPKTNNCFLADGSEIAWAEQASLIKECKGEFFKKEIKEEYKDFIKEIPQKKVNSYLYHLYNSPYHQKGLDYNGEIGYWDQGDFMLHMPGMPNEIRVDISKKIEEYIIYE